ncbi:MAG: septal ring lytic transglycosylase RlpA family protein [Deltaproteobacteria bacterium]|nr:septal ring lytic transglycosylase RlpA family protein [Deltaproteobacteria bacterium]
MKRRRWFVMAAALMAVLIGPADRVRASERGPGETGLATVYAARFQGKRTASGERYDRNGLTAAHKTLPFGTRVKVTRVDNGKSVVVRVNDRGPHPAGRVVDMSSAAAARLGMRGNPMARVRVEVLPPATRPR